MSPATTIQARIDAGLAFAVLDGDDVRFSPAARDKAYQRFRACDARAFRLWLRQQLSKCPAKMGALRLRYSWLVSYLYSTCGKCPAFRADGRRGGLVYYATALAPAAVRNLAAEWGVRGAKRRLWE